MYGRAALAIEPEPPAASILVVDDHEANRALAQEVLEDEGHRVLVATSGAEAIALFGEHHPDCVLLDIRMPGIDGLEVCARIRGLPGGPETSVIFLTALRDLDTFDRALHAGGDDFLTKPVRPSELALRVQAGLKLRRIRSERGELYAMLRDQRDALMRVALQKERLSAFLVHDLRNPVAGIQMAADMMLLDPGLSTRTRESADLVRAGAQSVLRMLTDLLDISRADEGRLALAITDVDLGQVAARVLESLGPRAAAQGITITSELAVERLPGDASLLRRVLENLVENAVRYAGRGTIVRILSAHGGDHILLRVADSGRGIPPELRERIFDRFVQADPAAKATGAAGRGLGLAFCKLVIEAHGGTIWVEDGNPGAVFCMRLPGTHGSP